MNNITSPRRFANRKSPFLADRELFAALAEEEIPQLGKLAQIRPAAASVYLALRLKAGAKGFCWPTQRDLAAVAGFSRTEVRRCVQLLAEFGLIVQALGKGKRSNRYMIRRLDQGPLREFRGPSVRTLKTREIEHDEADRGKSRGYKRRPTHTKEKGTRRRRGSDLTPDLPFSHDLVVFRAPAPPEEKEPSPTGPSLPAGSREPCGPAPEEPGQVPEELAVPAVPPAGGAGAKGPIGDLPATPPRGSGGSGGSVSPGTASEALARAGVRLSLFPELLRTADRRKAVLEAALAAQGLSIENQAGYIVKAVLGRESGVQAASLRARAQKGVVRVDLEVEREKREAAGLLRQPSRPHDLPRPKPDADQRPVPRVRPRHHGELPAGRPPARERRDRAPETHLPVLRPRLDAGARGPGERRRPDLDPEPPVRFRDWTRTAGQQQMEARLCCRCGTWRVLVLADSPPETTICPGCR